MKAKICIISGASSGIGAATAKLLASKGAHAVLLARNEDRLRQVAASIEKLGGKSDVFPVDLANAECVAETAARLERDIGPADVLVNNAGSGRWMPLIDTSSAEARAMIEVPYLATFNLTRAVLPAMLARRRGHIACVTSPGSFLAWPNACGYIAARHALKGFTDALRGEVGRYGIAVSLIVLGAVDSPYWEHNPGSREHLPKPPRLLARTLTVDEAATAIVEGIEGGKRQVVRPALFRALILLNALAPRLVERQLRRAAKRN